MNRRTSAALSALVCVFTASASAQEPPPSAPVPPPPAGEACFPSCREGYICHAGQCISVCNPPCAADEVCTSAGACVLRAPAAPPASATPSAVEPMAIAPRSGPAFSLLFGAGPVVGWFYGGQITLGGSIRLTDRLRLAIGLHGGGGTGSENVFVTGLGDLTLRIENWSRFHAVGFLGPGFAYLGEFEDGLDYEYLAPHAVLGGGFMVPTQGRFAFGVEARGRFGYANNVYNYYCDDVYESYSCVDYSGFYGTFELVALLHL